MKIRQNFLAAVATAALFTATAAAHPRVTTKVGSDHQFMVAAAQGGMAEVEMGRLAEKHASDAQVKQFGQRMVRDHSKANAELKKIAAEQGVRLPRTVNAQDRADMNRLSKLNGKAFDLAYMEDMVRDHQQDIAAFQKESDSGNNPAVKAFATKTLPTLQEHLKLAESARSDVQKTEGM
jgi:putative membrane protein